MSSSMRISMVMAVMLWALSITAEAQLRFRITPIENPNNPEPLEVLGFNDKAEVVGFVGSFGGRAYSWKNGNYVDLAPIIDPQALYTEVSGINNRSFIVGIRADDDFFWRGFLLSPQGQRIDIVLPTNTSMSIGGVNDRNQVIGMNAEGRPFIWRNGLTKWLPELPGTEFFSYVRSINNFGTVVGASGPPDTYRAVLWKGDTATDLGVLSGDNRSEAKDINESEQVVGQSISPAGLVRGVLWSNGQVLELPSLHGASHGSIANAINNWGAIAGASITGEDNDFRATLWINTTAVDLNSLVQNGDPLRPYVSLRSASRINDRGQIVAIGYDSRAAQIFRVYLLTPVH